MLKPSHNPRFTFQALHTHFIQDIKKEHLISVKQGNEQVGTVYVECRVQE